MWRCELPNGLPEHRTDCVRRASRVHHREANETRSRRLDQPLPPAVEVTDRNTVDQHRHRQYAARDLDRKRVGLARALMLDPELVLYDEPTTGLDPIMSDVINELIMSTRRNHPVTSIVVTHDMRTARKVADRVIMLYPLSRLAPGESQVLFDGPPSALDNCPDSRVRQFVLGEAGDRLMELREARSAAAVAN